MTARPPEAGSLTGTAGWGAEVAAGWISSGPAGVTVRDVVGPARRTFAWASVTKIVTALAVWVAVEEQTLHWKDQVGPTGSTLAHLLAHASGLAPDSDAVLAPPGTRRIYSNRGIELAADHLAAAAGLAFDTYAREAVLEPLGMSDTDLGPSPAWGATGPLVDLLALAGELLRPRLVSASTLALATAVAYPGLSGVLPGFGPQETNDWGLGVEVRDHKQPHWTGPSNSPGTFGHFGRSGSMLWVDPAAGRALVSLSERPFGPWAAEAWPRLSDAVLGCP